MAKVKGPLLSLEASGSFGDVLTYGKNRGVNFSRNRVSPTNPQTEAQIEQRTFWRVGVAAVLRMNNGKAGKAADATETPKQFFLSIRIAPSTWANVYQQKGYPNGRDSLTQDTKDYTALTPEQKTAWNTWNDALQEPFEEVEPPAFPGPNYLPTEVAYSFCQALFRSGYLATTPAEDPPMWDNTAIKRVKKTLKRGLHGQTRKDMTAAEEKKKKAK